MNPFNASRQMTFATTRIKLAAAAMLALSAGQARAEFIIDTTGSANGGVFPFGVPNGATVGQTITVPVGYPVLDFFTFNFFGPSTLSFKGYVYAWDGSMATGPALYSSPVMSLTNSSQEQAVRFNTGGISLALDSQYVMFVSVSEVYDSSSGLASVQTSTAGSYSGGQDVFSDNGSDFSALTTQPWTVSSLNLSFIAGFSVPEPSSLTLASIAVLMGIGCLWRRRKAR